MCKMNWLLRIMNFVNELGKAKFGKLYNECNEDEQKAIREYYPQKISEAEPKKYGGK